ncbi:hypothetical protein Kpol_507p9 [Vanderwaltozyma polyspora DSM 70294]|uniref:DUF155 domain-containing protein n=1 Tax=Vanderwaltozyma polyspora (strain ATCC 22028 / DSM 70294 / BCRC 21397 / CBS 2163 / NBRC 10782 / NRRL Y-8283 / UCD 57-17) TaxID=436907 RepID=A7TPG1_VANPO|nr:uncharacterized protein Kpol_507p9 [Vanderwaltozyma polyspora DSM 70294]EDO15847.1 hypothetical protein Kpol_507p9 [Vanderwaltozyma polyspora DSM 70294]
MSYNSSNNASGAHLATSSMSKRSPSILVTDSRSNKNRLSAPFARHAAGARSRESLSSVPSNSIGSSSYVPYLNSNKNQVRSVNRAASPQFGRFSDISIDNILSDSSDVPSGRREERRSSSSWDRFSIYDKLRTSNYGKGLSHIPPRTSKTSHKLVLIPENSEIPKDYMPNNFLRNRSSSYKNLQSEQFQQHDRDEILPRITAYNVAEGFNLDLMSKFLKSTHEVSPRQYAECLYVAYTLPLLPGKDGYRIKSNISKKVVGGKTLIDELIDTSEQRDHHYEYYSGVEILEDANNNYELNATTPSQEPEVTVIPDHLPNPTNNSDSFDPSEPQFFAEETPIEQKLRERKEQIKMNSDSKPMSLIRDEDQHAEIFIFHYGVIVFWNFTEQQEKNILGDIAFSEYKNLVIRALDEQDIETEQFHFEYDKENERPRIFNDIITLRSGDHIIELTLSHAIAQSSKLSRFESRVTPILSSITKLPRRLALYGTLGLKREQLLKRSGKLFKLRVDVNLSSSVLDTPEFFWSFEPSLHPLYVAMREYLEIDQRVQVLNDRCKVFLEFFDICVDSVAERNMARVTWWFIMMIIVSVLFSLAEILIRYNIIHNG